MHTDICMHMQHTVYHEQDYRYIPGKVEGLGPPPSLGCKCVCICQCTMFVSSITFLKQRQKKEEPHVITAMGSGDTYIKAGVVSLGIWKQVGGTTTTKCH